MSEIKVNKLSPRTNCGTVQLGDSGDTITIPAGATITNNGTAAGFGATGAASWDTTVKTSGFTAVSGVGYFVNTTSGAITVTLPASPDAGAVIAVKDYANTFDTNNVTLARNGSNIGGQAVDATLSTEGLAVTLVFVDATQGWLVTDDGLQSQASTTQFITATGGTITCCGDYKIHTFTGPGTFTVTCAGNASGSNSVDYLVVAGGAGGGGAALPNERGGGGGGAGGFRESSGVASGCYTASPLGACVSALPVTVQGYPITVGSGGAAGGGGPATSPATKGTNGANSVFSTIISTGGGGGAIGGFPVPACNVTANTGGSGGGVGSTSGANRFGGAGNTPPVSPPQGQPGGGQRTCGDYLAGGGGGGATATGNVGQGCSPPYNGGPGGAGATTSITASPVVYAVGGRGGAWNGDAPNEDGGANTGTGGAGGGANVGSPGSGNPGNTGGSGIVIIRYKFQ